MSRFNAFVTNEDVRRIAGFVVSSGVFAILAWQVYLHVDHDQWAPMFLFFALAGLSVIFALMTVFFLLQQFVFALVNRVRRSRQPVSH